MINQTQVSGDVKYKGVTGSIGKKDEKVIRIHYYPQDPLASNLEDTVIPASYVFPAALKGPRDIITDGVPVAQPDANGEMKYAPTDKRFDQIEVLLAADKTLKMWENYSGHRIDYAFSTSDILGALPHAGEDFNAYYSRWEQTINFFSKFDNRLNKMIHSAQSYEIVAHEKGHATLDGWKPKYLSSWSPDAGGFHESFGDISAMLLSLQSDQVVTKMLSDTAGNIRKPNIITRMGEELSRGIADVNKKLPPEQAEKFIIRDAANKLVWQDPKTLPSNPADPEKLGSEVHNYSRLFTGAVWDIFCSIAERNSINGDDAKTAVVKTRDEMGALLAKMIDFGPDSLDAYRQLGKAMLVADAKSFAGKNRNLIANVMVNRKILTQDEVKQIETEMRDIPKIQLPFGMLPGKGNETLVAMDKFLKENAQALKLSDSDLPKGVRVEKNAKGDIFLHYQWTKEVELNGLQYKQYNGAYIDVPGSIVLGFDSKNNTLMHVDKATVTEKRAESAKSFVRSLINEGLVKYFKPFEKIFKSSRDMFKSAGQLYVAFTSYSNNGAKMKLEPVPIIT